MADMKAAVTRQKGLGGLNRPGPRPTSVHSISSAAEQKSIATASSISFVADSDDELLTDDEVMKLLKIKNKQWLADHRTRVLPIIPHVLFGREIRYPKRLLLAWIASLIETRPTWERDRGSVDPAL